jgi:hypothetical protein
VWLVIGLLLAVGVAFAVLIPAGPDTPGWAILVFLLMTGSLGTVGALIVTRQPRNTVGWILWLAAIAIGTSISASTYAPFAVTPEGSSLPAAELAAFVSTVGFLPAIVAIIMFVPLLFPDGRLIGRRWRWVAAAGVVIIAVLIVGTAFAPGPLENYPVDNPLGIPAAAALGPLVDLVNGPGVLVISLLAIASSILRYRRGPAVERAQLRWFGAASGLTLSLFAIGIAGPAALGNVGWVGGLVSLSLVPFAIGIAILRYRLYEIDRIVSRTIGWAIVTGVLVTVFLVVVVALQALLASVTDENTIAVAASTLVAFALFQPVRRRVQRAVDRRFDRARYDGQQVVDAFGERLRHEVDVNAAHGMLVATASEIVRPQAAGVWLRYVRDAGEGRVS